MSTEFTKVAVMEFIDTHCHLFWEGLAEDLAGVVGRARNAGVTRLIVPATTLDSMRLAADIATAFDGVYSTAGVHPHDTRDWNLEHESELRHPRVQTSPVPHGEAQRTMAVQRSVSGSQTSPEGHRTP